MSGTRAKQHLELGSAQRITSCGDEQLIAVTAGGLYTAPVTPSLVLVAVLILAAAMVLSSPAPAQSSGKIGLIGDSMTVATHADEMCGAGKELPSCLDDKLGLHDMAWSHASGVPSWSIASRLGYTFGQAVNVGKTGRNGRMRSARRCALLRPVPWTPSSSTSVPMTCATALATITGDLPVIAHHIDDTLSYLLSFLPSGAKIYWTGTPKIVDLRNVMAVRRHNYIFRSCQAFWDLDPDEITEEAAASICHKEGLPDVACENLADWKKVHGRFMHRFLAYYKDQYN